MEVLFKIISNFHRGPFTTAIGIMIALASIFAYFFNDLEPEKAIFGVLIGAAICGLPDPKMGGKNKNITANIAIFALFASLISCSKPPVTSAVEQKDSTWTTEKEIERPFFIKGDKASMTIDLDDLNLSSESQRNEGFAKPIETKKNGSKKWKKKSNQASIEAELTQDGKSLNITGNCDSLTTIIKDREKIINRLRQYSSFESKPIVEFKTHWYDYVARVIALFYIALLIITKIKI